jgi:hypothetical protein
MAATADFATIGTTAMAKQFLLSCSAVDKTSGAGRDGELRVKFNLMET